MSKMQFSKKESEKLVSLVKKNRKRATGLSKALYRIEKVNTEDFPKFKIRCITYELVTRLGNDNMVDFKEMVTEILEIVKSLGLDPADHVRIFFNTFPRTPFSTSVDTLEKFMQNTKEEVLSKGWSTTFIITTYSTRTSHRDVNHVVK